MHRRRKIGAFLVRSLFHTPLAVANFAASRIDYLAGFRRLLDDLYTRPVARFAFDFVF